MRSFPFSAESCCSLSDVLATTSMSFSKVAKTLCRISCASTAKPVRMDGGV